MVFTDGIIEAYSDERGEQFGGKKLLECFRDFSEEPIDCVIENIINRVTYSGFAEKVTQEKMTAMDWYKEKIWYNFAATLQELLSLTWIL